MLEQNERCYVSQNAGDWQKGLIKQSCHRTMSGNRLLAQTTMQIHIRNELLPVYSSYIASRISNKEVEMFIRDGILPEHKERNSKFKVRRSFIQTSYKVLVFTF
jgi:hypothetical protein